MANKKKLKLYISGIVITSIIGWISPSIFPTSWFINKELCPWTKPCIQPEPYKGRILFISLGIIFIIFLILTIKTIIDIKRKKQ